jgi:hypothetical protein
VQLENSNKLVFSWPAVDDALIYQLKLQVFRDGETVVLGRVSSSNPGAVIELAEPLTQHRYEWVLSGDTQDKQSFQTSGGFVVSAQIRQAR